MFSDIPWEGETEKSGTSCEISWDSSLLFPLEA